MRKLINAFPKRKFDIYKPVMMWNTIRFEFEQDFPRIIDLKTINRLYGFEFWVK